MNPRLSVELVPVRYSASGAADVAVLDDSMSVEHLSTAEAAALLGWAPAKVRTWVRDGRLAAVVVGGNVRVARSAVDALLPTVAATADTGAESDVVALVEMQLGARIADLPLLLEPEWLAPRLGMSAAAVRRSMRAGEIPALPVGRRLRCPTVALVRWLAAAGRVAA